MYKEVVFRFGTEDYDCLWRVSESGTVWFKHKLSLNWRPDGYWQDGVFIHLKIEEAPSIFLKKYKEIAGEMPAILHPVDLY